VLATRLIRALACLLAKAVLAIWSARVVWLVGGIVRVDSACALIASEYTYVCLLYKLYVYVCVCIRVIRRAEGIVRH
jgi:hypothetical protein